MAETAHPAQKVPDSPGGKVGPEGTVEAPAKPVEGPSFKSNAVPDPNDLLGPAGDPAEGKRPA